MKSMNGRTGHIQRTSHIGNSFEEDFKSSTTEKFPTLNFIWSLQTLKLQDMC